MQGDLLPLFPLRVVLFPGAALPLHVFEDRYKEMIGEVIAAQSEFGVVLARENGIVNVGCTASVEKVMKRYPDGRMDIQAVGRRRFEIILLNEEKSYLRAPVSFFDDEEAEPAQPDLRARAVESWRTLCALHQTVAEEPDEAGPELSFHLAQAVPDLDFRQVLLNVRSEAERIRQLVTFLEDYVPRRRYTQTLRGLASKNGQGLRPPELKEPE